MQEYHFRAELAAEVGVEGAVLLHSVAYWIAKNQAGERNFFEGRTWTYNSLRAWVKLFPFWSQRQMERVLKNLRESGHLLVGNFSADKTERTLWYSLSDAVLEGYELLPIPISPIGEMHFTDCVLPFHQTVKCNKEQVLTNYVQDPPTPKGAARVKKSKDEPNYQPEWFSRFWMRYPRHTNRQAAVRAWDKLRPNLELCHTMSRALEPDHWPENWHRDEGRYIMHPSTWLNGRRWEDEGVATPDTPAPTQTRRYETREVDGELVDVEVTDDA